MFAILRRCFQIESCFKRQTKIPMQVQSAVKEKICSKKTRSEIRGNVRTEYVFSYFFIFSWESGRKKYFIQLFTFEKFYGKIGAT